MWKYQALNRDGPIDPKNPGVNYSLMSTIRAEVIDTILYIARQLSISMSGATVQFEQYQVSVKLGDISIVNYGKDIWECRYGSNNYFAKYGGLYFSGVGNAGDIFNDRNECLGEYSLLSDTRHELIGPQMYLYKKGERNAHANVLQSSGR